MIAVHSVGERMDVSKNAPGTWRTSCLADGVVGGVHEIGESDVDGKRGIAFGDDAYTIAG
jgi:hypothetical protein